MNSNYEIKMSVTFWKFLSIGEHRFKNDSHLSIRLISVCRDINARKDI